MTEDAILLIAQGAVAGFFATVTMDVLGSVTRRFGLARGAKGEWVGRWYLGIPRGQFVYSNIATAPERIGEKRAALIGHYAIGIILAAFYVLGAAWQGVAAGLLPVALGYGLATCVFPWFLVFPALGFGLFGLKGPHELRLFTSSLLNHFFYGLGLWWAVKILQLV